MECREARHLLNQGVVPSSYDVLQATLGFHIAMCVDCRTYRAKLAYRQSSDLLLAALLSQQPPLISQQLPSSAKRPARRAVQLTSAALAIGAVVALSPGQTAAATTAETPTAPLAATQSRDDVLAVDRQHYTKITRVALASESTLRVAEAQAAPASDQSQQTTTVHVVTFGESLWSIAQFYYGNGTRWQVIYDENRAVIGANPSLIYPGARLTIPAQLSPAPVPQNPGPATYVVQPGDSLWSIAQQAYGDGTRWSVIYQANPGLISNPSLIYPGTALVLPR